jgi:hypothetical protein
VIIPQSQLSPLFDFFKTGRNPTHKWVGKGDWKAVYYMNEKEVSASDLVKPLEELIDRTFISAPGEEKRKLEDELMVMSNGNQTASRASESYRKALSSEVQRIVSSEWFALCSAKSEKLKNFAALASSVRKS